jgi:hypothetical protein
MASKRIRDTVGIDPDRVVSAALQAALGETSSRRRKHHPGRALAAGAAIAAAAAVGQKRVPRLAKVPLRMGLHKLGDMAHVDDLADAVRDRLVGHHDEPDDDYEDEDFDDEDFDDEPVDEAEDESEPDEDEGFDDDDEDEGPEDEPEDDDGPRGEGDETDDEDLEDEEPEEDLEDEPDDDQPDEDAPADEELDDDDLEGEEPEEEDEDIAARSVELGARPESNGRRARGRVPDVFEALRTPHRRPPVMRATSLRVDPARRPPQPDHDDAADEPDPKGSRPGRSTNGRSTTKSRRSKNQKSTAARA